jgi:dTDP-4-dehydrorhamnose reductase
MRLLVTGASGQLGAYVVREALARGHEVVGWSGRNALRVGELEVQPVDLIDCLAVLQALREARPEAVLHLAAMSRVDAVFAEPERARRVNVVATAGLASWCFENGTRFVSTSTDLVFAGDAAPYREADAPAPLLAYGRSKWAGEQAAHSAHPEALVARLSLLYGPSLGGEPTFYDHAIAALSSGQPRPFFTDEFRTPLPYSSAAEILVRLVEGEWSGIVHVGGPERMSRHELFVRVAREMGLDPGLVREGRMADVVFQEPRPVDVSLDTTRLGEWLPGVERIQK